MKRAASDLAGLAGLALLALGGCGAETLSSEPCPPGGTTLTYQNFGKGFFSSYCTSCHGGANAYSSRAFVTVDAIRAQADRIYVNAARDNSSMPPGPDAVPRDDRYRLGEWLSCGAP